MLVLLANHTKTSCQLAPMRVLEHQSIGCLIPSMSQFLFLLTVPVLTAVICLTGTGGHSLLDDLLLHCIFLIFCLGVSLNQELSFPIGYGNIGPGVGAINPPEIILHKFWEVFPWPKHLSKLPPLKLPSHCEAFWPHISILI